MEFDKYDSEARKLYGDEVVDKVNDTILSMSNNEKTEQAALEIEIKEKLSCLLEKDPDLDTTAAKELSELHAMWLKTYWRGFYTPARHIQLAKSYLLDPRFIEYYDGARGKGATELLVECIDHNIS